MTITIIVYKMVVLSTHSLLHMHSVAVFLVFCGLYPYCICGQFIFLLGRPVSEL